jgi:inosine-uridine nucleoside N-ribohydrolase
VAEPIILDTDLAMGAPGSDIDDGFALALALADPALDLRLVTTVNGNTDVESATVLTLELLDRLGRPEVPVHRGADRPLRRPRSAHGGAAATAVRRRQPAPEPAVTALVAQVLARPGEITLVAVGPLTTVAQAIRAEPGFAPALRSLMIMGGKFLDPFNSSQMPGEFNVWSDPEAAQIVLDSGIVASWVGLDVTLQVRLTRAEAEAMAASARPYEAFAGEYTVGWIDHLASQGDDSGSCALHDPLAVAAVSRPDLVTFRPARLAVDTGDDGRGMMTADLDHAVPNARVGVAVDAGAFAAHFRDLLARL